MDKIKIKALFTIKIKAVFKQKFYLYIKKMEIFHPENTKEIAKRRKTNTNKRKEKKIFLSNLSIGKLWKWKQQKPASANFPSFAIRTGNQPIKSTALFGRQQKRERNY